MNHNPYQAPQADLINYAGTSDLPGFYVVSKRKMIILFLATLGSYQAYWFYRNWQLQKQATRRDIWPLPRALFSILFVHELFRAANDERNRGPVQLKPWSHSQLATVIVMLSIISNIADRVSNNSIGSPFTNYLPLLLLLPSVACLSSAQERINEACGDPLGESNRRLGFANYLWIILGLILWAFIVQSLIAPSP